MHFNFSMRTFNMAISSYCPSLLQVEEPCSVCGTTYKRNIVHQFGISSIELFFQQDSSNKLTQKLPFLLCMHWCHAVSWSVHFGPSDWHQWLQPGCPVCNNLQTLRLPTHCPPSTPHHPWYSTHDSYKKNGILIYMASIHMLN